VNAALLIARRELAAYLRSMTGYVIIATVLALLGLLFNSWALGGPDKRSADVLRLFFELASALIAGAALFLAMRLLAEERQSGTLTLLYSSPVSDLSIVLGKYLSGLVFLAILLATTAFMPALILVHGKVAVGQVLVGYLGLWLYGGAALAIGVLGSALARTQVLAVILSGAILVALFCLLYVGQVCERPLSDLFGAMAYFPHFRSFESGLLRLRDVVYYVAVAYVALFGAVRVLAARRWR